MSRQIESRGVYPPPPHFTSNAIDIFPNWCLKILWFCRRTAFNFNQALCSSIKIFECSCCDIKEMMSLTFKFHACINQHCILIRWWRGVSICGRGGGGVWLAGGTKTIQRTGVVIGWGKVWICQSKIRDF